MVTSIARLILGIAVLSVADLAHAQNTTGQADTKKQTAPTDPGDAKTEVATVPLVINLAGPRGQTIRVDAGTYRIVAMNAIPGRDYWLHVGPSVAQQLPALQAPNLALESRHVTAPGACPAAAQAIALLEATEEVNVPQLVEGVRIALARVPPTDTSCDAVREIVATTQIVFSESPVVIGGDALRNVVIENRNGDRWSVEVTSMGRGVWQTTYGFAFSPNHDEEYFTDPVSESAFKVTRKPTDEDSFTFIPSVFFTWLSTDQALKSFQHGPTIGLGVTAGSSGGRLGVLAGWSFRFNQNIGIASGLSLYQHRRLDGQYQEGQLLKESLDSDKLNADSIRANLFLAFTLRFGSSPFGGAESKSSGAGANGGRE